MVIDRVAPLRRPAEQDEEVLEGAPIGGRIFLPRCYRHALLRQPAKPLVKPLVFENRAQLARAILRDRKGEPIQMDNAPLLLRLEPNARQGVNIYTLAEGGSRHRYLGWAWLSGGDRDALEAALFAECPDLIGGADV